MKTRRFIVVIVVLILLTSGCSSLVTGLMSEPTPTSVPTPTPEPTLSPEEEAAELARIEAELAAQEHLAKEQRVKDLKFVFLIPGTLENPIYNSAYLGLKKVEAEYGSTISCVEMGKNPQVWKAQFLSALEEDWDFIITLNDFTNDETMKVMTNLVSMNAPLYPEKKFIFLWGYSEIIPPNVVTMNYNLNEATFLAGACAALVTTSDMKLANEQPLIGFIGGMSINAIKNQYMLGYIEGAKYINEDIKIMISYTENFENRSLGERHAAKQYSEGADVIFQAAGKTGYGVINGAEAADRYVIGVDNDQAQELEKDYPEKAAHIITSVLRKYDGAVYWAIDQYAADTLEFGKGYYLGIAEDAVGIVKNSYYNQIDPEIITKLADIEEKIKSKEINLDGLEAMDDEKIEELIQSVAP
ncbi:MAG: BMP family ABC transporter substrate-binding protein [Eubacteriales bacterium]|nr:BMP family ABC transporter substrate-binding protein [Eubacteriales bacterium]